MKYFNFINLISLTLIIFGLSCMHKLYSEKTLKTNRFYNYLISKLKSSIHNNGIFFIKIVQHLADRIDILPEEICKVFNEFHENCEGNSYQYVKHIVDSELTDKTKTDLKFETFDGEYKNINEITQIKPYATGSISEVYKVKYNDNICALKIKHEHLYNGELKSQESLFRSYFKTINYFLSINININGLIDLIKIQLNFDTEHYNIIKFTKLFENNPHIVVPKCYFNTSSTIMMSFEFGNNLNDLNLASYADGYDKLLMVVYQSMLINGYFHSDLHRGNVKYRQETQQLIFYDFGLMIEFNDVVIDQLIAIMLIPPSNAIDILTKPNGIFDMNDQEIINKVIDNIHICDDLYFKDSDDAYFKEFLVFMNNLGVVTDAKYFTFIMSIISSFIYSKKRNIYNNINYNSVSIFSAQIITKVFDLTHSNDCYIQLHEKCRDTIEKYGLKQRIDEYNLKCISELKSKYTPDIDI